jgi:hypothetical protein
MAALREQTLFERIIGVATLDTATFEEIKRDESATVWAAVIAILAGVSFDVGAALLDLGDPDISFGESLALFGYPISEEFVDPATGLVTQYFEHAVFEYHPDNPEPYKVLLRRLGAEEMKRRDW